MAKKRKRKSYRQRIDALTDQSVKDSHTICELIEMGEASQRALVSAAEVFQKLGMPMLSHVFRREAERVADDLRAPRKEHVAIADSEIPF